MIRKYRKSDQEEVVAVWLASSVLAHPFIDEKTWLLHADDLRKKYLPNADTWIYEQDGKVIGFISLLDKYIGGLFILPEWQGKGIGRQLIQLAKAEKGRLTVGVFDKNTKAKAFYFRCGFVYDNEEIQSDTGEKIINLVMSKSNT